MIKVTDSPKTPTAGYLIVQAIAVGQVAVKEGLWTEDKYVEHVLARSKRFFGPSGSSTG